MRVLLSGAGGFVGSNVLDYMLDMTDWTFVTPCSWRNKGNPQRLNQVLHSKDRRKRVEVLSIDLRHPLPDLGDFEYIYSLASNSHVDRSIANPVEFIESNVSIVLQMLEYARAHRPLRFIQFSTDEVFGPDGQGPSSPYAASKAAQEVIVDAYYRTYNVPVITVNSSNIVGPMQDAEKFVPRIMNALRNNERISIHTHNGLVGYRYYDAVDNVAAALVHIVDNARTGSYQLGPGEELDNLQMAQKIADILAMDLKYQFVEVSELRPGYDTHYHHVGCPVPGFHPVVSLEYALRKAVDA